MEWSDRRRFLRGAFLWAGALAVEGGPANENGGAQDADERLARLARAGLDRWWVWAASPPAPYRLRLSKELRVIREQGVAERFLAAAEVARFAHQRGIPLGPGRGAAPSSLVAYALGVTAIDPIAHGLIFERFLNGRLARAPDICIDVCAERVDEVKAFVARRWGQGVGLEIAGLPALTALSAAVGQTELRLSCVQLDDPAAYRRLSSGEPIRHPYLEPGPWLGAHRPRTFEELMAVIALTRPGVAEGQSLDGLANDLTAAVHPLVQPILAVTRGRVLYQEQIMAIAAEGAGYSLEDADVLRRALAKGHPEHVAGERDRFVLRAIGAGVYWPQAVRIFALLERTAPSSFNRSHAVACALMVYWAAYVEAHRPGVKVGREI